MSTNIEEQSSFLDAGVLQDIANHFFKSVPGSFVAVPLGWKEGQSIVDSSSNQFPVSGIAPAGIGREHLGALPISQLSKPLASPVNASGNPGSVAGSGISPTAYRQENEVDLNDPQTALSDPHFVNTSSLPVAASEKGLANRINSSGSGHHFVLPFADSKDLLPDLSSVFASFTTSPGISPLALPESGIREASFYFINEGNSPYLPAAFVKPDNAVHHQSANLLKPLIDVNLIKKDFPILREKVNGKSLIWLDNAATTQKPRQVIERLSYFYQHENSNIHRAAHDIAARATDAYEGAREKVRHFINAASVNEIVFVRGTTEAINLVAKSYGEQFLKEGDEIIISQLEHHANIVPWQQLAKQKGLKMRVIPVDEDGQLLIDEYLKLLNSKTRLVAFTQVSNALGTITPAKQVIDLAHAAGAKVLLDGAQSISHLPIDIQYLNPDFFVFSGHKIFGPTGIGVLFGKEDLLNEMQPWQGGGNMIKDVTFEHTQFHNAPSRFEAGTGNIADAVGLGAALDYVSKIGIDLINQYEHSLLVYATRLMKEVPGLRLIGTAAEKASVLSFTLKGYKNEEVGIALNKQGIAVRTGHHCAQPILRRFGLESTVRPSLAFYNTCSDIDAMISTLHRLARI